MHVDLNLLSTFTIGALESTITGGELEFHRLPKPLHSFYRQTESGACRLACPSGVRLRFCSDTRSMHLSLRFFGWARNFFSGVLLVDGIMHCVFGPDSEQPEWSGIVFQQSAPQPHCFDICLPHLCVNRVKELVIDDGATLEPVWRPRRRWLAYGDSITQGMTVRLPCDSYVSRCTLALGLETLNLGIGGATYSAELAADLPEFDWSLATVAYGVNDCFKDIPPETVTERARALFTALRRQKPNRPILALTPISCLRHAEDEKHLPLKRYREALRAAAKGITGVLCVEGPELVPADPALFVDDVHPNELGMAVYAERLRPVMEAALDKTPG